MSSVLDAPTPARGPTAAFGALAARLSACPSRLRLAQLPTPVQRAPWLDVGASEVWIKRDDASSDIYGGGKVRKLEWVLARPPYDTGDPIVSLGGIGSHHLLALALFLREQGRTLHGLTFETTPTDHVLRNLAVLLSSGARLWHVRTRARLPIAGFRYYVSARPERMGRYMAAGASTAIGCLGFVEAGLELAAQIEAGMLPSPDAIYVAAGSAGTAAGLALGLALGKVTVHLHLVSSVERWAFNRWMLGRKLADAYRVLCRHGLPHRGGAPALLAEGGVTWDIDHGEVGEGYGVPTDAALARVREGASHGLVLETTYTAKCLSALQRREAARHTPRSVLFWNTHAGNDLQGVLRPDWAERCPPSLWRRIGDRVARLEDLNPPREP